MHTQCTERREEWGANRGPLLIFAPGPPCWLIQPFSRPPSTEILAESCTRRELCIHHVQLHTCRVRHTNTPPLTCHSHFSTFQSAREQKTDKDRNVPALKHRKPARVHTIKQCVHTASVKSGAHKRTHTDEHAHTHTVLSACVELQGDGRLFVCLHCCFWCVCDTTRPRSLPLRPLIPQVEMKCNGADSIRALPPRETRRIKSHQIPQSLPSIHCCLVVGREIKQWWLIHLALCTLALTQRGWSVIRQALRATKPIQQHDGCFCSMFLVNSVYSFAAIAKTHMLTELVHSLDTISTSQC